MAANDIPVPASQTNLASTTAVSQQLREYPYKSKVECTNKLYCIESYSYMSCLQCIEL